MEDLAMKKGTWFESRLVTYILLVALALSITEVVFIYQHYYVDVPAIKSSEVTLNQLRGDNSRLRSDNQFLTNEIDRIQREQELSELGTKTKFEYAVAKLFANEGIYSNNPSDRGGETVYGIARKYSPDDKIWDYIDNIKKQNKKISNRDMNKLIVKDKRIFTIATKKYQTIWSKYDLDSYPISVGSTFFDIAVNCGESRATIMLQTAINALNDSKRFGRDLNPDGVWGKNVTKYLTTAIRSGYADRLTTMLMGQKTNHYTSLASSSPSQRKFLIGWLNRE